MRIYTLLAALFVVVISVKLSYGDENASNPLAAVNNTDLRTKFYELTTDKDRTAYSFEGAYMISPKFKMTYKLHYWDTDLAGQDERTTLSRCI